MFYRIKRSNISVKNSYNPYDQIIDTIKFLQQEDELKGLVHNDVEKHAFIVSPDRQKIPRGIESKERELWKKLQQQNNLHYVKVTKSDKYSNNKQIICSSKSPVIIPFSN